MNLQLTTVGEGISLLLVHLHPVKTDHCPMRASPWHYIIRHCLELMVRAPGAFNGMAALTVFQSWGYEHRINWWIGERFEASNVVLSLVFIFNGASSPLS